MPVKNWHISNYTTYDKYGNWTTRLESVVPRYTGGLSETTVRREMEYFD